MIAVGTPPPGGVDRDVLRQYWATQAEPERKARFEELLEAGDQHPEHSDEQNRLYRGADALRRWYDTSLDTSSLDAISSTDPVWVRRVLIEGAAAQDWPALLSRVSAPVLLVLGAYDFVAPPLLWDKEIGIPKLTRQVLPRSGHQPFFDEPEQFLTTLCEWLQANKLWAS